MEAPSIQQVIKQDMWDTGQALKVLAYYDLSRTDPKAFFEKASYQPFPSSDSKKRGG
ncbi:TPA: hypothetical protein ACGOTT_002240 [Streptococcus suis]|nr:hypothetical protein [Streptococcus suis]